MGDDVQVENGLVRWSRWLYGYMGSDGGAVPWGALFFGVGSLGLGAGVATLAALLVGGDPGDWAFVGFMVAAGLCMAGLMLASVVVFVAWLLKIGDDDERRARRSKS